MSKSGRARDHTVNVIVVGLAVLALGAGVVLLLAVHGVFAMVAGIVLVGLAGIVLVSLAFLLVGQGEDRDRMRRPNG
jgi:hypothetical protein